MIYRVMIEDFIQILVGHPFIGKYIRTYIDCP